MKPGCHSVSAGDSRGRPGGGGAGDAQPAPPKHMSDRLEQTRAGGMIFEKGEADLFLSLGFIKMGHQRGAGGGGGGI